MLFHMIGNAHIDPVWLWRWPEGMAEMLSTCHTMVELLNESDDLIFTKGEAVMYEWIEKVDPQLFQEISKLVKSGKWNIVNGWWVQPDCNLPNGESFVRQGLYGKKFFKEKFGVDVKVGYNVDSFGHAATLPQILKKSGFEYYVFMRPGSKEKQLPSVFKWKTSDGSEIVAFRLSRSYVTGRDKGDLLIQIKATLDETPSNLESTMCFYGVGDHGGGPTKEDIKYIREHKNFSANVELKFSSPDKYFEEIKEKVKKLPVVEDELQYHSVGSYSVNSKMKIMNRKAENELLSAEKFASIANFISEFSYPYEELENSWKSLLFNQFHDLLGGTAIREAYEDAYNELGGVINKANKIKHLSIQAISKNIDTKKDGIQFVIFNPSAFEREEYVEFEPWLNGELLEDKVLVDADENEIEYQNIPPTEMVKNTYRIVFKAKVPPLGYVVYRLKNGKGKSKKISLNLNENTFENECFHLEIDEKGYFKSFYDKINGIEHFLKSSNVPIVIDDKTDTWSHGIPGYSREYEMMKKSKVRVKKGNLKSTIEIEFRYRRSKIVEYISLYANDPILKIHFFVDWHEPYKTLKLSYFLPNLSDVFAEIPYGIIKRPANGQEYPMQRSIFCESNGSGLMIANNGKYAYDFLDDELRLTILRNPPYAWHTPYKIIKNRPIYFTDEGIQEFDLWFLNYAGKKFTALKCVQALNEPLETFTLPKHSGTLPSRFSFGDVRGDNVLLETLKMSESRDNSLIARVWETNGLNTEFSMSLFGKSTTFDIGKNEIKTLKLKDRFEEANLMENKI